MTHHLRPREAWTAHNVIDAFGEHRLEAAIRDLEARAWRTNDPEALYGLGTLYLQRGWRVEAEAVFRKVLEREPVHVATILELGELYLNQALPYSAIQVLEVLVAQGVADPETERRLEALRKRFAVQRVSVCAMGFGDEEALEQCVSSITEQTYPIHEILLIDEGAPGCSPEIGCGRDIRRLRLSGSGGQAAAWSAALERCRGAFLARVEAGVVLEETWLERLMLRFVRSDVGGVGGRLIERRVATGPDRWRRKFLAQHWGGDRVVNPRGLFGANCAFRVEALESVRDADPSFQFNFEAFELSARLRSAGWTLIYEPQAVAYHHREDDLLGVLQISWARNAPSEQVRGAYDSVEQAASCLEHNRKRSVSLLERCLEDNAHELLYPGFLLRYSWSLQDLEQVGKEDSSETSVAEETIVALLVLAWWEMSRLPELPPRVIERTWEDLAAQAGAVVRGAGSRNVLGCGVRAFCAGVDSVEQLMSEISRVLPRASIDYLRTYLKTGLAMKLDRTLGVLLDRSVGMFEALEQLGSSRCGHAPRFVIVNPPAWSATGEGGGGCQAQLRWLEPSRIEQVQRRLRLRGARVLVLDAVAEELEFEELEAAILGWEAEAVIYVGDEHGMDRLVACARRLKLVHAELGQVLVDAARIPDRFQADDWPMFDEAHRNCPDRFEFERIRNDDLDSQPKPPPLSDLDDSYFQVLA